MAVRNEKQQKYFDMIYEAVQTIDTDDLVNLHNEYCERNSYYEDMIYRMSEVDDILGGYSPSKIIYMCWNNTFRGNDAYFQCDGENFKTCDFPYEEWIDMEELANFVEDTQNDFGISELEDVLWEIEDMEEHEDEEDEEMG